MAKKSKRLLSAILAVMMLLTMFPITMPVASAADAVSVDNWDDLIAALRAKGNSIIKITKDINYEKQGGFSTFSVIGDKTIDLNGYDVRYGLYTNMADPAMERAGCQDTLFYVGNGAVLTIDDTSSKKDGKLLFDAYMHDEDDFEKIAFRDVIEVVSGGTFIINAGTVQGGRMEEQWVTALAHSDNYSGTWHTGYVTQVVFGTAVVANSGSEVYVNGGTLIGHGGGFISGKWGQEFINAEENGAKVAERYGAGSDKTYYGAAIKSIADNSLVVINNGNLYGYAGADALCLELTSEDSAVLGGNFKVESKDKVLAKVGDVNIGKINAGHIGIRDEFIKDNIARMRIVQDGVTYTLQGYENFKNQANLDINRSSYNKDVDKKEVSIIPCSPIQGENFWDGLMVVNYNYKDDYFYKDVDTKTYFTYNPNGNPDSPAVKPDFTIKSSAKPYYAGTDTINGFKKVWKWEFYSVDLSSGASTIRYTMSTTSDTINLKDVLNEYDFTSESKIRVDCTYMEYNSSNSIPVYASATQSDFITITKTPLLKMQLPGSAMVVNETYDVSRAILQISPSYNELRADLATDGYSATATYTDYSGNTVTQNFSNSGKLTTNTLPYGKTEINYSMVLTSWDGVKSKEFTYSDYLYRLPAMTVSNATKSGDKYIGGTGSSVTLTAPAIDGIANPYIGWFKLDSDGTYKAVSNTSWGKTSWNVTQAGTYCYALQPNDGKNTQAIYSTPVTIEFENDYNTITVTPSASYITYENDTDQEGNITFEVTYGTGFTGNRSGVKHELISWPAGAEEAIKSYGNGYSGTSFTLKQFLPTSAKDVNKIVPGEYVFRTKATNTSTGVTYYSAPVTITVRRNATGIDIYVPEDGSILNADTYWTNNKYRATYYTVLTGETLQLGAQPNYGASEFSGTLLATNWTVTDVVGEDVATISKDGVLTANKPGQVKVDVTRIYRLKNMSMKEYTQSAYIDIPVTDFEITMGTPSFDADPQTLISVPADAPYTADVSWYSGTDSDETKFLENYAPQVRIEIVPKEGYVSDLLPEEGEKPLYWNGTFANSTIRVNGEVVDLGYFDGARFDGYVDSYYYYNDTDGRDSLVLYYNYPDKLIDENDIYESVITMNIQVPSIYDNVDMVIPEDPEDLDVFTLNAEILNPGFERVMDTDIYMVDANAAADFDVTNDNAVKADPAAKYEAGQLYRVKFTILAGTLLAEDGETYRDVYLADNLTAYVNGTYCLIERPFTGDKYAEVTYYFTPEEFTRISEVDILGVKAPVANADIVEEWDVIQDGINVSAYLWFVDANENGAFDEGEEVTDNFFGFNTEYSLYIALSEVDDDLDGLGDDVRFESSVTVRIGDETAEYTMSGNYDGAVYTFPATGEMEELSYNDDNTSIKPYVGQYVERSIYENVSGGLKPYTFEKVSGPDWLSIDAETGVISGTPTKVSDYDYFTFTVTDANGDSVEHDFYIWDVNILPADREIITSVTATTDIEEILVYGGEFKSPTYTTDSVARFLDYNPYSWEIKDENGDWVDFEGDYFLEGTYRISTQVRIDYNAGVTHMFDAENVLPVTVDGQNWNTSNSTPDVYDTYSYMWVESPEFTITKPENTVIDTIEITGVSSPNIGDLVTASYPIYKLPAGAKYTVTSTEWFRGTGTTPADDEVFTTDYRYGASFKLKVAPGYEFAAEGDITVTINGKPADVISVWSDGTADVCLLMDAKAHVEGEGVIEVIVEPTCTNPGSYDTVFYCTECGEEIRRYTSFSGALGHTWDEEGSVVTDPTCTTEGYTTYTCIICGEKEDHDYVDALGHTYDEGVISDVIDATCTTEGSYTTTHNCTVCGVEITSYSTTVEALGHTPAEAVKENIIEATESTEGSYESVVYCSVCGDEISRTTIIIPVIGAGTTISGNYVSFNSDTDTITIALFAEGEETALQTLTKTGNEGTYEFTAVADGTYTIIITKKNHVTRTYTVEVKDGEAVVLDLKIHLKGDINGDGKVIITDYTAVLRHVKKTQALEGYAFDCADVNGDGKVIITDYTAILRHVKKTQALW